MMNLLILSVLALASVRLSRHWGVLFVQLRDELTEDDQRNREAGYP